MLFRSREREREGASKVKLFGEEIGVKARIMKLNGISGHADNNGLIKWISAFEKKPDKVFVTHGEDTVCDLFAARLRTELGLDVMAPYSGTIYDLAENKCIEEGKPVLVRKTEEQAELSLKVRLNTPFGRLLSAGERLMSVIRHNEGGANKDLGKFADQIISLCEKWDR